MKSWRSRGRCPPGRRCTCISTALPPWTAAMPRIRHRRRAAGHVMALFGRVQTSAHCVSQRRRRCAMGRLVEVADTKLYVEERGAPSGFPLLVFHGGPGLDHTWFGDYLDPLTGEGRYRLVLADERACGRSDRAAPRPTWTLGRMAQDVSDLAASLGVLDGYATLGHSYGAFLVLQHAVDHPAEPRGTIVSAGIAAARWLE